MNEGPFLTDLQDQPAEQAAIGSVLIEPGAAAMLLAQLQEDDFSLDAHRRIWRAIAKVGRDAAPVDLITVCAALRDAGDLDAAGGAEYLSACQMTPPTAAHCAKYAGIVLGFSRRRKVVEAAREIEAGVLAGTLSPDDAAGKLLPLQARGREETVSMRGVSSQYYDWLEARLQMDPTPEPPLVGLPTLDRQLGGLSQEEVVVFKAGEKTGKTTLLRQSALETARWLRAHKSPAWVLLYHLEGGWRGWMSGAVTYLAGIERSSLRRGALQGGGHDEEWRQIVAGTTELDELPLRFNTSLRSLSAVSSDVILHQARGMKLCGIWIDYLQKLDVPGLTDTQQVRAASDGLVKLHERTGVPIITASQVTRGEHGTRTYFGAAIQHDASLVLDLERGPKGCRDEHKIHSSREARIMNTLSRYDTCLAPLELTFDGAHARFIEGRPTEYEAPRQDY